LNRNKYAKTIDVADVKTSNKNTNQRGAFPLNNFIACNLI